MTYVEVFPLYDPIRDAVADALADEVFAVVSRLRSGVDAAEARLECLFDKRSRSLLFPLSHWKDRCQPVFRDSITPPCLSAARPILM